MSVNQILILKGSPRENGNSSILADRIGAGVRSVGAVTDTFVLHNMDINPCDHCDFCRGMGNGICIVEDDMNILYPKIIAASGIVIASPIYWFTFTAQTKLFIDRLYALEGAEGSLLSSKRFAIALAYGDTDPFTSGAINAIRTFQDMFRYIGADLVGFVYGSAMETGEFLEQESLLNDAFKLGQKLAVEKIDS